MQFSRGDEHVQGGPIQLPTYEKGIENSSVTVQGQWFVTPNLFYPIQLYLL